MISWQCLKYCVNEKTGFRYNLLYMDSVFKYKNKLVHNQAPIMNWLRPFLLNLHQRFLIFFYKKSIDNHWIINAFVVMSG